MISSIVNDWTILFEPQMGPKSNGNEGVLHILPRSWTGASPSGGWMLYQGDSLQVGGGVLPNYRNAVGEFCSSN